MGSPRFECVDVNNEQLWVKATNNGHPIGYKDDNNPKRVQQVDDHVRMFPELDDRPVVRQLLKGEKANPKYPVWRRTTRPRKETK